MGSSLSIQHSVSFSFAAQSPIMKIALAFLLTLAVVSCQVPDLCPTCVKELSTADYDQLIAGLDQALSDGQLCTDLDDTLIEFITLAKKLLAAGTDATLLCQLMG